MSDSGYGQSDQSESININKCYNGLSNHKYLVRTPVHSKDRISPRIPTTQNTHCQIDGNYPSSMASNNEQQHQTRPGYLPVYSNSQPPGAGKPNSKGKTPPPPPPKYSKPSTSHNDEQRQSPKATNSAHMGDMRRGPPPSYEYHLQRRNQSNPVSWMHRSQQSADSSSSSDTNLSQRNGGSDFGSGGSLPLGYGGWSPSASVVRSTAHSDEDRKKAQVAAYTSWVNIQLRRRPGSRPIDDLKRDMQDGVALAHLIEIIAGVTLEDIHEVPSSEREMEENVEKAIHFMTASRIRMHHTTAQDIVSGNIKPIMRLILALAAHFKPNSVRQSSTSVASGAAGSSSSSVTRGQQLQQTVAGIAQGAAAALADIKRDALRTSQRPRRPKQLQQQENQQQQQHQQQQPHHHHQQVGRSDHGVDSRSDRSGGGGSPAPPLSPRPNTVGGTSSSHSSIPPQHQYPSTAVSKSQEFSAGPPRVPSRHGYGEDSASTASDVSATGGGGVVGELEVTAEMYAVLQEEHETLRGQTEDTKTMLLKLQTLILNGRLPDGEEDAGGGGGDCEEGQDCSAAAIEGQSAADEVAISRAKLQQSEHLRQSLRHDLSKAKQECLQLQGVKSGLQERLSEQENSLLVMKAELLRAGFCQQSLDNSNTDLQQKLEDKDRTLLDLRRELAKREREIDEIKASNEVEAQQRETVAKNLRAQITDLHERLRRVGETEATLSARVASQDRKMARLEGKILQNSQYDPPLPQPVHRPMSARSTQSIGGDDYQLVRDSLQSLRTRFPGNDPQRHTIDQLEESISSLMDRLTAEEQKQADISQHNFEGHSMSEVKRSPQGQMSPGMPQTPVNSNTTKVLYFTDRTVTPFMCTLQKRLGEVTLADIKALVDRPGGFRYHFKAMDPEFGTVKEEISHDEDIIPGWEGKIVAWIEEDHG